MEALLWISTHIKTATDRNISANSHFWLIINMQSINCFLHYYNLSQYTSSSSFCCKNLESTNKECNLSFLSWSYLQFNICGLIFISLILFLLCIFSFIWGGGFLIASTVFFRKFLTLPFFLSFCSIFFRQSRKKSIGTRILTLLPHSHCWNQRNFAKKSFTTNMEFRGRVERKWEKIYKILRLFHLTNPGL